jgi:hypothetical protein
MSERIFWKRQDIIKDYKQNNFRIITYTSIMTFVPFCLFYGIFYERLIRKTPFSLQLSLIILAYQFNKNFILQSRHYDRKIKELVKLRSINI